MKKRIVVDTFCCMIDRQDLDFSQLKRLVKDHGDKEIVMELNVEESDHEWKTWDLVVYEEVPDEEESYEY